MATSNKNIAPQLPSGDSEVHSQVLMVIEDLRNGKLSPECSNQIATLATILAGKKIEASQVKISELAQASSEEGRDLQVAGVRVQKGALTKIINTATDGKLGRLEVEMLIDLLGQIIPAEVRRIREGVGQLLNQIDVANEEEHQKALDLYNRWKETGQRPNNSKLKVSQFYEGFYELEVSGVEDYIWIIPDPTSRVSTSQVEEFYDLDNPKTRRGSFGDRFKIERVALFGRNPMLSKNQKGKLITFALVEEVPSAPATEPKGNEVHIPAKPAPGSDVNSAEKTPAQLTGPERERRREELEEQIRALGKHKKRANEIEGGVRSMPNRIGLFKRPFKKASAEAKHADLKTNVERRNDEIQKLNIANIYRQSSLIKDPDGVLSDAQKKVKRAEVLVEEMEQLLNASKQKLAALLGILGSKKGFDQEWETLFGEKNN